eukprot:TRINITY_DN7630_c0_g1_i2.p1 TRINITY_DN7630_c0_g1~~TRINITY_DN7630_c0_g1_i2.p1  ORF type:complete len:165 (-),score=77.65 TRINITY_DN7630_c0_g1_i2:145-639(-)
MEKSKFCFIMRGIPGSGKTIVAKKLIENGGVIHTPGVHFVDKEGGVNYDPSRLSDIKEKTFKAFCASVEKGQEVVVLDDSNLTSREYFHFLKKARDAGYLVAVVDMVQPDIEEAQKRNSYGIDKKALNEMATKWEPFIENKLRQKSLTIKERNEDEESDEGKKE